MLTILRQSVRSLWNHPGFSVVVVLSVALGVTAVTTTYHAVDRFLLHPLDIEDPAGLVEMSLDWQPDGVVEPISYPAYLDYRDRGIFSGLAVFSDIQTVVGDAEVVEQVEAQVVSPNFFDVLGVEMAVGRSFSEGQGEEALAVLSWGLWRSRFGGDRDILGSTIRLRDHPYRVIGVAPPSFRGLRLAEPADLWVPVETFSNLATGFMAIVPVLEERGIRWLQPVGRLRGDIGLDVGKERLSALARELTAAGSRDLSLLSVRLTPSEVAALGRERREKANGFFSFLGLLVLFELTITSSNLSGMFFARALQRRHEAAVRFALGASRWELALQLFVEGLLVTFCGAIAGLALTKGLLEYAGSWKLASLPALTEPGADVGVMHVAVALGLAVLVAITFSVPVSWRLGRLRPAESLKDSGTRSGGGRDNSRKVLITLQVAVAVVLLIGTGLFARSLLLVSSADPGFRTAGVLEAEVNLGLAGYDDSRARAFYLELPKRLAVVPGVDSTGWAAILPLGRGKIEMGIEPVAARPGPETEPEQVQVNIVTPGMFETLGIPLERGRGFTAADRAESRPVAVVSAELADRYWPGQDPTTQRIELPGTELGPIAVVGVASNVKIESLDEAPRPFLYLPLSQHFDLVGLRPMHLLLLSSEAAPVDLIPEVRSAIRQVGAGVPVLSIHPWEERLRERFMPQRIAVAVLGLLSLFAVIMIASGIYGLLASFVAQRRREIGLRMALGAAVREVVGAMVHRIVAPLLIGLIAGVSAAALLLRLVAALLFGLDPLDLSTFTVAVLLIALIAVIGSFRPIQAAVKVDPAVALRQE